MIEKLDITNFGSFKGFSWDAHVLAPDGNVVRFKKINIFYGRNYSGKTTLSRVFRSFEVGDIPANYEDPSFKVKTGNEQWTQEQLNSQETPIRVYNKDFVEANLEFLRNNRGEIEPFAILGAENKEIGQKIEKINQELGSKETNLGIRAAYFNKQTEETNIKNIISSKEAALTKELVAKANSENEGIKHNDLYKHPYYNVRNLAVDIELVQSQHIAALDESARFEKINLLAEKPLKDISLLSAFESCIEALDKRTVYVACERIQPSVPLQDLLNSAALANWVREGRQHHLDRDCCAFCRQPLPIDLIETLNKHFNEESEALQSTIHSLLQDCDTERSRVEALAIPEGNRFYSTFQTRHVAIEERLTAAKTAYLGALGQLDRVARKRSEKIFANFDITAVVIDFDFGIDAALNEANELIRLSNEHTAQIGTSQKLLRDELRLSEVAAFVSAIGLVDCKADIENDKLKLVTLTNEREALEADGMRLRAALDALQVQLQDEKLGAERVNQYLGQSLSGTDLRLQAREEEGKATYKFQIMRGDQLAFNLSEGECSLVAFCYFLARLDDVHTCGKKPIIYIDDPISSLDNNHIFFIYSLIESAITMPLLGSDGLEIRGSKEKSDYCYEQLFISTHNLEFLKYLKRLRPSKQAESFMISRNSISSCISLMPEYLRSYITELNYLFSEIHTCTDDANTAVNHHSFYNFGNNLRKFLEAYLFFKYPSNSLKNDARLKLFFGNKTVALSLVKRLTNEHSHLEEFVDRGMAPIDCAEIAKTAKFVLGAMEENDSVQYQHFIYSINAQDSISN